MNKTQKNTGKKTESTIVGKATQKKCTCVSEFQDQLYGKQMRAVNVMHGKAGNGYRCTVCGAKL